MRALHLLNGIIDTVDNIASADRPGDIVLPFIGGEMEEGDRHPKQTSYNYVCITAIVTARLLIQFILRL